MTKLFDEIFNKSMIEISNYKTFFNPLENNNEFLNENLVFENKHKEVNIGQKAISYLKSNLCEHVVKINLDILKIKILTSWKYYDEFSKNYNDYELFLFKTDFRKPHIAANRICELNKNINFNEELKSIKSSMTNTNALIKNIDDNSYIILIDEKRNKNLDNSLNHEFTHFVQCIIHKMICVFKDVNQIKNIKNIFDLNNMSIDYLTNPFEFFSNIYNDFFNGSQKIYWSKFKDSMEWDKFIDVSFEEIKNNPKNFKNTMIYSLWISNNLNNLFYINFLACINYLDEDSFNDIMERLKNK